MASAYGAAADTRVKVFISSTRADAAFADQLAAFLGESGFKPIVDHVETGTAEERRRRLGALILEADAVVFVLTANSAGSEACAWEAEEAQRLGKRVLPVLPEPLHGAEPPANLANIDCIYFYSDPAVPHSGFFDGQKRLQAALRSDVDWMRMQTELLAQATRWVMGGRNPDLLLRGAAIEQAIAWREGAPAGARIMEVIEEFILASFEWRSSGLAAREAERVRHEAMRRDLRKARERDRKDEKKRQLEERALAQRIAEAQQVQAHVPPQRPGVRFPVFRASVLGLFAAAVLAVVLVPGMPGRVRSMLNETSAAIASLAPEEEPYSPNSVAAEDFAPERDLVAVRGGANVRNYPLTSGTLLANVPQGTRLRVTGRLMVQGMWWYRVVMADDRVGFVREDVVRWSQRTPVSSAASNSTTSNIEAIEPAVQIVAGRAGANLRTRPTRSGAPLVRLPAGAEMNATGKVRQGGHWWVRVALADGREGFVRDDVLTSESRAVLDLEA